MPPQEPDVPADAPPQHVPERVPHDLHGHDRSRERVQVMHVDYGKPLAEVRAMQRASQVMTLRQKQEHVHGVVEVRGGAGEHEKNDLVPPRRAHRLPRTQAKHALGGRADARKPSSLSELAPSGGAANVVTSIQQNDIAPTHSSHCQLVRPARFGSPPSSASSDGSRQKNRRQFAPRGLGHRASIRARHRSRKRSPRRGRSRSQAARVQVHGGGMAKTRPRWGARSERPKPGVRSSRSAVINEAVPMWTYYLRPDRDRTSASDDRETVPRA